MYATRNFKTKKAFREAVERGDHVTVYQPNDMVGKTEQVEAQSRRGPVTVAVEGPHYPEPHRWYATATVENGVVTKVR